MDQIEGHKRHRKTQRFHLLHHLLHARRSIARLPFSRGILGHWDPVCWCIRHESAGEHSCTRCSHVLRWRNQEINMFRMILMILGIWAGPCSNVFFVGPVSSFDQSHSDSLIMFSQWTQASETSSDLKIKTSMQNPCMSMYRPWQWHDRTLNTQNTQTGQAGSTELAQNMRLSPLPGCLP